MSVNLYSSYDLDDMALKEQKFFIDGLLPEGLSFIAGPPKFGKTYLDLQLAVSVASGEEFLGRAVLNPCNVLYLYLEGDAAQVKQRLHDIYGEGRRFPRGLYFVHEIQSLSEGGLGELFRIVTDYDIRLVIIDTWQLVRGEATLRGTAYQREYNELTSLRNELYGKLGVSVLLTHHTKQIISGKHVDDLHMLNGSSALSGCADAVLLITGKRGSDRYWLTAHGRTFEDVEIAMERTNPMGWRVAGVGTPSLQKRILEILAEHPRGVTATCIHAVIPAVPEDTIRRQLNRWASAGVIKKDGKVFRLP